MSLQPGRHISQSFRLQQKIAEGGMGSVWKAHHLALNRTIALKFLNPSLLSNAEAVQRFVVEAQAAASISSPHVPQIFDHGTSEDGVPYIAMEYLEGEELYTRLHRAGTLSLPEIVRVVEHVCLALHAAHGLGIVHRDIKPENIFLVPDGRGNFMAKLLDFGIAKAAPEMALESLTQTGATMGTPAYMSPEQLMSSRDVDYHSDYWSLGVVAYYCLTGKLPFEGETFAAVCVAIDRARFILPSALREDLPPAVDQWFQKALSRDPKKRFSSARDMSHALRSAVEGRPSAMALVARQPTRPPRPRLASDPTLRGTVGTAAARDVLPRRSYVAPTLGAVTLAIAVAVGVSPVGRAFLGNRLGHVSAAPVAAALVAPSEEKTPTQKLAAENMPPPPPATEAPAVLPVEPAPPTPARVAAAPPAAVVVAAPLPTPRTRRSNKRTLGSTSNWHRSTPFPAAPPASADDNPYGADSVPRASVGDPNREQSHADDLSRLVDAAAPSSAPAPGATPQPPPDSKWNAHDDLGEVKDEPKSTKSPGY